MLKAIRWWILSSNKITEDHFSILLKMLPTNHQTHSINHSFPHPSPNTHYAHCWNHVPLFSKHLCFCNPFFLKHTPSVAILPALQKSQFKYHFLLFETLLIIWLSKDSAPQTHFALYNAALCVPGSIPLISL